MDARMARPERERLIGVAVLTLISMVIAGVALCLELNGGDGGRLGMLAGAPLLAAGLLEVLGGRKR